MVCTFGISVTSIGSIRVAMKMTKIVRLSGNSQERERVGGEHRCDELAGDDDRR